MRLVNKFIILYKRYRFALKAGYDIFHRQSTNMPELVLEHLRYKSHIPFSSEEEIAEFKRNIQNKIEQEIFEMEAAGVSYYEIKERPNALYNTSFMNQQKLRKEIKKCHTELITQIWLLP